MEKERGGANAKKIEAGLTSPPKRPQNTGKVAVSKKRKGGKKGKHATGQKGLASRNNHQGKEDQRRAEGAPLIFLLVVFIFCSKKKVRKGILRGQQPANRRRTRWGSYKTGATLALSVAQGPWGGKR